MPDLSGVFYLAVAGLIAVPIAVVLIVWKLVDVGVYLSHHLHWIS